MVTSDAELIAAVRAGDETAYDRLYRRHSPAALRFARSLTTSSADAEDAVAEGFARVLAAVRGGNGPAEAFRPYLLSAVRNAVYDLARRGGREQPVADLGPYEPEVPVEDPVLAAEERSLVAAAFDELPERWQVVLWHTEVEGERPAAVAPLLGISPNAVAALAYRAREGLRERYLQAHLAGTADEHCRPTVDRLGAYTRRKLSRSETEHVRRHLKTCAACALLFGELTQVNSRIGAFIGPAVLGSAALAYVTAAGAGAGGGAAAVAHELVRVVTSAAKRPEALLGAGGAAAAGIVTVALALLPGTGAPLAQPAAPAPSTSISPSVSAPPNPSPSPSPTGPTPPAARPVVIIEPVGSLVRGQPGLISLTIARPGDPGPVTGLLTATFRMPAGVSLRGNEASDHWECTTADGLITCSRQNIEPGSTTRAHIPVSVSAAAADGEVSVTVSGPGVAQTTAQTSQGVQGAGLGALFAQTGPVTVVTAGNSLLSCGNSPTCVAARAGVLPADNDGRLMAPFRDLFAPPGAPALAAVSGATVAFGGEVVWAGLFWAGSGLPPPTPELHVRVPGSGSYQPVAAQRSNLTQGDAGPSYQAGADVTALAHAAAQTGTWWVAADGDAFAGGTGAFGGWALLAVVESGTDVRTVAVLDGGGAAVRPGYPVSSTVDGLSGSGAMIGLVAWDGDRGTGGDTLTWDGAAVGEPSGSNIAHSGASGVPWGWHTFGTDARVLSVGGGPGSGSDGEDAAPAVTAATTGDAWLLGALAVVTAPVS